MTAKPVERNQYGLEPKGFDRFLQAITSHAKVQRVLLYGSRARGDFRAGSDVDIAVDAPGMTASEWTRVWSDTDDSPFIVKVDLVHLQDVTNDQFRANILRDAKVVFERGANTKARALDERSLNFELKDYQQRVLDTLDAYLDQLIPGKANADKVAELKAANPDLDLPTPDFPTKAWEALRAAHKLPEARRSTPYSPRQTGAGQPVPNACLKIPTGGGKTLLASAAVSRVFARYFRRNHGLVLWIVPNEAIYRQTKKTLSDRDHPYRQMLDKAAAGRVKILEKDSPLAREDVNTHLCVMLLMLASAARKDSENTLRFFRDRGNVRGFFPREDDVPAHHALKTRIANLDVYGQDNSSMGLVVRDSLANAMRVSGIMVVIDEGQKAYSPLALKTVYDFNPAFVLELSATPKDRPKEKPPILSNWLVDIRGTDLDSENMIKLPIQIERRAGSSWQDCLRASLEQLNALQRDAEVLQGNTGRYIRPIMLVQVERTSEDQLDSGLIHAKQVRAYLAQLGLPEAAIAEKTSETDELKNPENIDLLRPACPVRVIITKQALQEGWDCPFAYVLCALAANRNLASMTQLVGRILRQPHTAKTGSAALDACYVYCFQVATGDVVAGVKKALESEGMGDLAVSVRDAEGGDNEPGVPRSIKRRDTFRDTRIFLPRVVWADNGVESARLLDYERDVLSRIDWSLVQMETLASRIAANEQADTGKRIAVNLNILDDRDRDKLAALAIGPATSFDPAFASRAIFDVVGNAWRTRELVGKALAVLRYAGFDAEHIGALSTRIVEELRTLLATERDRLAEQVFLAGVQAGKIQFRLRADARDWTMPMEMSTLLPQKSPLLYRASDGKTVEKSLFAPVYDADFNSLEAEFACYIDEQAALRWWHRNVAQSQYALQGWKRHKVYPDFIFALDRQDGGSKIVVMETKGLHLQNEDTDYKRQLLETLTQNFSIDQSVRAGNLQLVVEDGTTVQCDLVFEQQWKAQLQERYFN